MVGPGAEDPIPEGSEPINFGNIKFLRVRGDQLFWKGRRVHTRLTLDPADRFVAWAVAIATILAAVATIAASIISITKGPEEIIISGQKQPLNVTVTNPHAPAQITVQPEIRADNQICGCDISS